MLALVTAGGMVATQGVQAADERHVDCELTVQGKTYIKGVCFFRPESGGGFQISGEEYFAQVAIVGPGKGEAHWNASPTSTHAQAPLGAVERKGACWVGAQATICARELPPERARELAASLPGGEALFPVLPGASACIVPDGPLAAGATLVLRNCRLPADRIFVRSQDGLLGFARHRHHCLGAKAGTSGLPRLVIEACRSESAAWKLEGSSREGVPVQSSDGLCIVIPQLDQPDARFPFSVHAVPCATAGDKAVKFFLSKG